MNRFPTRGAVASRRLSRLIWGWLAAGLLLAGAAQAQGLSLTRLTVEVNHSRLVDLPGPVKRVSVGSDKIADVVVISARQLYVNGRGVGSTNITLWDDEDQVMGVFEVQVGRDLTRLKENLHQVLPGEPIEVREMEGAVVLSGQVSSLQAKAGAEAVAEVFAPKKVTSLLQVGGHQQVVLKVRFAEVTSQALQRLGINLAMIDQTGGFFFTMIGGLTRPYDLTMDKTGLAWKMDLSRNLTGLGSFTVDGTRYLTFLDALKEDGFAKILAEPNLVTSSGQEARFLAGGEFPIPVPQDNRITIEYKKFGVQLKFKPEILTNGRIRLKVAPEVSELDFSTALVLEGFAVPGLKTRQAETQLELENGQSFAIAGLLRDDITETVSKVPILGDIPILGALFRSSAFQKKKTELVIVVTPEIVQPGQTNLTRWPTRGLKEPNALEFYLLGLMVERDQAHFGLPLSIQELEGEFGHDLAY